MKAKERILRAVSLALVILTTAAFTACDGGADSHPGKWAYTLSPMEENLESVSPDETGILPEETKAPENSGTKETIPEEETSGVEFSGSKWDQGATYTGGMEVEHEGKIYRAKWWTQGDKPDSSATDGPWEYIGEAKPAVTTKATEPEPEIDDGKPDAPTKAGAKDFKIVGYYPSWEPDRIKDIQYDHLTHINYAFAIPQNDGTLRPLENPEAAQKIIKAAHKKGVKVLIAIGGWSYNDIPLEPNFVAATDSPEKIEKFAGEIMAMVDKYGFDGVDMDWEHPRRDGNSSKQYEDLMTNLSKQLHAKGKLLTSAVLSGVTADGNVLYDSAAHTDAVINAVDWFNVMAYDGGDGERHSSYDFGVNSANYWKNTRKMPAEKVVLGVPFYGRPSWQPYRIILEQNPDAYSTDVSTVNGMEAHYNGIPTIQKKTQWACENVGGIMIWELSQDSSDPKTSLLTAIFETAKKLGKIS